MTTPASAGSRWSLGALVIGVLAGVLTIATVWVTAVNGGLAESGIGEHVALLLAFYAYLVVGLILIARRPNNALGWVLAAIGLLTAIGSFSDEYARLGLAQGRVHRAFGAVFAAWITQWWWFPAITLVLVFVPQLFPTGKPVSPRWRWLLWLSSGTMVATAVGASLAPVLGADTYTVVNPIGVDVVGDIEEGGIGNVLFFSMLACMLLSVASAVVRFRRSRGVERQQLKWFLYAVIVAIIIPLLEEVAPEWLIVNSNVGFAIVFSLPPIAIGIAVTRYRLYEIDRLISRTLTYGLLTAVLIALYLVAVTAMTRITAPVTRNSPVAVAAATLIAAAAFGPARRRIQHLVDRRFNRARYDAARAIDGFRSHLRDEIDLASITASVQNAVDETVQPSRVVVWLRQEAT